MDNLNKLYFFVTDHAFLSHSEIIDEALEGGISDFVLRMPNVVEEYFELEAWKCRFSTRNAGAKFHVQDKYEIAKKVGADGVFIMDTHHAVEEVRQIAGGDMKVGVYANSLENVVKRAHEKPDYIVVGPVFISAGNENFDALGIQGVRQIIEESKTLGITVPLFAGDGILKENLKDILSIEGINGIAVSKAIVNSKNIKRASKWFAKRVN